jgi:hypothetical protein
LGTGEVFFVFYAQLSVMTSFFLLPLPFLAIVIVKKCDWWKSFLFGKTFRTARVARVLGSPVSKL